MKKRLLATMSVVMVGSMLLAGCGKQKMQQPQNRQLKRLQKMQLQMQLQIQPQIRLLPAKQLKSAFL